MARAWFLIFKILTIGGLCALWWAVFSVDLRVVQKERKGTEVVRSGKPRETSRRKAIVVEQKIDENREEENGDR